MAATNISLAESGNERPGGILTWSVTILACVYIAWTGGSLYYSTPIFLNMYSSMGVELPLATKVVIAGYRFFYPVLFGGAAALVITKQFFVREKWISVSFTLGAIVVVGLISQGIVRALYRPLFDLAEKLSK